MTANLDRNLNYKRKVSEYFARDDRLPSCSHGCTRAFKKFHSLTTFHGFAELCHEQKGLILGCKRSLKEFGSLTTFHGFAELCYEQASRTSRFVWIIFVLSAYGYCAYLISNIIMLYIEKPIVSDMAFESIDALPMVHINPTNPFDPDKLRRYGVNKTTEEELLAYLTTSPKVKEKLEFNKKLRKAFRQLNESHTREDVIAALNAQHFDGTFLAGGFRQYVREHGPSVHPENFTESISNYAFDHKDFIYSDQPFWISNVSVGYRGVLYSVNMSKGMGLFSDAARTLYIRNIGRQNEHASDLLVSFVKFGNFSDVYEFRHRFITSFFIQMIVKKHLKDCTDDPVRQFGHVEQCKNDMLQKYANCCDCTLTMSKCRPTTIQCCTAREVAKLNPYPENQDMPGTLRSCLRFRKRPCKEVLYSIIQSSLAMDDGSNFGKLLQALGSAVLNFHFLNARNVPVFTERQRFEFDQALSDIGGVLGLLVGGSVLSMAQLVFFCANIDRARLRERKAKKAQNENELLTRHHV